MWKITLLPKEKRPGIRPINSSGWNNIPYHKLGQVGIETSIAFVTIVIFFWGVTQLFLELNRSIINRQRAYQQSRKNLGILSETIDSIDFYDGRITIFPEER